MSGGVVQIRPKIGFAFEQLTVSNSVQVLTPSRYAASEPHESASSAFITLNGGNIRYTYDGTTPTSSTGHLLNDSGTITLLGQNQMALFKCIQTGATSSEISITYERE